MIDAEEPFRARSLGLGLYATAVAAAFAFGPRGPVYWDSFGYVAQSITGQIGGIGLGRPVFVIVSHAIASAVRGAGGSVFTVEPVLRIFWLAIAAWSAPLTRAVARACGLSPTAAVLAGIAVAFSPAMGDASAALLTDGPCVAVTLLALLLVVRAIEPGATRPVSLAFAAGAVLGVAFGLREQALGHALALGLLATIAPTGSRVKQLGAMFAGLALTSVAPLAYTLATQPEFPLDVRRWIQAMSHERTVRPYGLRDFLTYLAWLAALGPAALAFGVAAWRYGLRTWTWPLTAVRAVCLPSIAQLLLLAGYQDISYSPRYLVAAFPGALAIPAGWAMARWAAGSRPRLAVVLAIVALPFVISAPIVRWREQPTRDAVDAMPRLLGALPAGAVVVTGQPCPAMDLYQRLLSAERGTNPDTWQHVCPGWEWPHSLPERLDAALAQGHVVAIDARDGAWLGREQRASRDEAERYAAAHPAELASRRIIVWR